MVCTAATWLFLRPGVLAVPVDLGSSTSGAGSAVREIIYIFCFCCLYFYGRQPSHDFQIWLLQPFALGCAGWSPVGPSPHEGIAADDA